MPKTGDDARALRIVIVDDDRLGRLLLMRSLEADYDVVECQSGFEALQMLEGGGPALVVLDYEMPDINGAQVCELIRASRNTEVAQSPIIMLTGRSNAEHEVECLRAGADDFVTKPLNLAVLRARIDTHLRVQSLRGQLLAQKEELERWRGRQEEDLEAARLTQQAILPARLPVLEGWDFGAEYRPLMRIGGDIYDWVKGSDGSLLVWMSDATGHGASAALLTTLSKLLFRHAAAENGNAAGIGNAAGLMDYVEREFQAVFKGRTFMTAACLVLSPGRGRVTFCGAGQPPLLVMRRSGEVESIRSARPPLGLNKAACSIEESRELAEGDGVLLYTDGLYEMQNAGGERLGQEALARLLPAAVCPTSQAAGHGAGEWLASIVARAEEYAGSIPLPDDIAAFAAIHK